MRCHLITGIVACSLFLNDYSSHSLVRASQNYLSHNSVRGISDFQVVRLSGDRVMVSWHTNGDNNVVKFEVMRKHKKGVPFVSLGIVEPRSKGDNSADYTFIDANNFTDSTYYCLKKTNIDSVIFFSISKGVQGAGKQR
jgi:hypothetical protein